MTGFSGLNNDNGLWLILLLIVFGGFNNNCGCNNVLGTSTCGCNNVLGTSTCNNSGNEIIWLLLLSCFLGNNNSNNCIAGCGCS